MASLKRCCRRLGTIFLVVCAVVGIFLQGGRDPFAVYVSTDTETQGDTQEAVHRHPPASETTTTATAVTLSSSTPPRGPAAASDLRETASNGRPVAAPPGASTSTSGGDRSARTVGADLGGVSKTKVPEAPASGGLKQDMSPLKQPAKSGRVASRIVWLTSPWNQDGSHAWLSWTFFPLTATLKEAFAAFGMEVQLGGKENVCKVMEYVHSEVSKGRTPIVIVLAYHMISRQKKYGFIQDDCEWIASLKKMSDMGGHLIFYNTEPMDDKRKELADAAKNASGQEIWSYSRYNLKLLGSKSGFVKRYLPPGCASLMDFGVNHAAPDRDDSKAGFLGAWRYKNKRRYQLITENEEHVAAEEQAFNSSDIRRFLERFPVQLNLHGQVQYKILELFRVSMLLTNSACVFTDRVIARDIITLKDIVHEFENFSTDVLPTLSDHSGIRRCQEESHRLFCERYQPKRLLEESGLLDLFPGGVAGD